MRVIILDNEVSFYCKKRYFLYGKQRLLALDISVQESLMLARAGNTD